MEKVQNPLVCTIFEAYAVVCVHVVVLWSLRLWRWKQKDPPKLWHIHDIAAHNKKKSNALKYLISTEFRGTTRVVKDIGLLVGGFEVGL
jgi:uncharacterized Fe-S cluster-containing MiaB family protein